MAVQSNESCREEPVPTSASEWTRDDLENIGIFYQLSDCSVRDMISNFQSRVSRRSYSELPEICFSILQFMKESWSFTLGLQLDAFRIREGRQILRTWLTIFPSKVHKFCEEHQLLLEDPHNLGIYYDWYGGMQRFVKYLNLVLKRVRQGEDCRGTFENLFTKFSAICLLVPENGKACQKEAMSIQGVSVYSAPDFSFPKLLENDQTVVSVTEVKEDHLMELNKDDFDIDEIPDSVLGRHGAELLLQTYRSYFSPVVAGMILVGTKIIFTYLDVGSAHMGKLQTMEDIEDSKSVIHYTKPYDFMDATDREEILEPLMWLGYMQSIASSSGT